MSVKITIVASILLQFLRPALSSLTFEPAFDDSSCGIMSQSSALIYGGRFSKRAQFPWIVSIAVENDAGFEHKGSGSLISNRHVLTAAHVVSFVDSDRKLVPVSVDRVRVFAGKLRHGCDNASAIKASSIVNHPHAKEISETFDINGVSLVTLESTLVFTKFVQPVCLWPFKTDHGEIVDREVFIVGYGEDESGRDSLTRKHVRMTVAGTCDEIYREELAFGNETRLFCVRGNGIDTSCLKDSQVYMKIGANWYIKGLQVTFTVANDECDPTQQVLVEDLEHNVAEIKKLMLQ